MLVYVMKKDEALSDLAVDDLAKINHAMGNFWTMYHSNTDGLLSYVNTQIIELTCTIYILSVHCD